MEILMLLPLAYHVYRVRKDKKQLLSHTAIALLFYILCFIARNPYVNGCVLLLCLAIDAKGQYLLLLVSLLLYALTFSDQYALFIWILLELVFVSHHRFLYKSYEQQMQEYQNKVFDKQVMEVENMFMTMRGWRHDYHNHLQNLKAKLRKGEIEESLHYLDELENELNDIRQLVESGNTNMDAILNAKLSLALNQGIDINVKAQVPSTIPISDTDICALLGNLVDNAVEACEKLDEDKYIRLYVGKYKGQLYISCTNATNEVVRKLDKDYITTKRGNHGHGLKRMDMIVEKYDGYINRKNEPGVFITEIMLPI